MKKNILFLILCLASVLKAQQGIQVNKNNGNNSVYTAPANLRSDTINILKTTINLTITDFTNQVISGNTIIHFTPKINGQDHIMLDLLKLSIDSIKIGSSILTYDYNDTLLKVNFSSVYTVNDTLDLTVYYHGTPQIDATGFGGFIFDNGYAYNLGVGFDADPHNYGRAWFPCFDNFIERCAFEFNITTNNGKLAVCNGELVNDVTVGPNRTRTWVLNNEIPSYLASTAVNSYTQVNKIFPGLNGPVPVVLAALPGDTAILKSSFIHLQNAFDKFEQSYGPYQWNRVGYVLVPFQGGAMEHVTNIAYPKAFVDGTTANESDLMAHELSHHWWGDLVTCETAEDMWINEGMASYSSFLFNEAVYGYSSYLKSVKDNHDLMVHNAHLSEKGYRAISGVPHAYTYGDHVYNKGADVAHTMRGYLDDTLFYAGLKYTLSQKHLKSMNSVEFGNLMTTGTGVNMNYFFNDWVLNGGWPHFSIDSFAVAGNSPNYTVTVYVKQKLTGAQNLYTNVPLELTFMDINRNKTMKTIVVSGATSSANFSLSTLPVYVGINLGNKISDAISSEYRIYKGTGTINFNYGRASITIGSSGIDSSFIRVEHNFTAPDPVKNNTNNYSLNKGRYWKIDGILSPGFHSNLKFYYDGRKVISSSVGSTTYLDTSLTVTTADSMILLYRRNAADDWREVQHYTKTRLFVPNTRYGYFTVDTLMLGEYTFANGQSTVLGVQQNKTEKEFFTVYPNPAKDLVTISFESLKLKGDERIQFTDESGKIMLNKKITKLQEEFLLTTFSKGLYIISIYRNNQLLGTQKLIIE